MNDGKRKKTLVSTNMHLEGRHWRSHRPLSNILPNREMSAGSCLFTVSSHVFFSSRFCNWFSQLHFHFSINQLHPYRSLSSCDLEFLLMTRTIKLDLDGFKMNQHAKHLYQMWFHLKVFFRTHSYTPHIMESQLQHLPICTLYMHRRHLQWHITTLT